MPNYGHINKPSNPEAVRGGYKNVLLVVQKSDITAYGAPIANPVALGDVYTIATAHTFAANKGYYEWATKLKSVVVKGATVGDPGSGRVQYTFEAIVLSDNAATQEQMSRALIDDNIYFVKDSNCLVTDTYIQLGDECDSPEITVDFDSMNTDGTKNWKITGKITGKRYFYNAALVKAA